MFTKSDFARSYLAMPLIAGPMTSSCTPRSCSIGCDAARIRFAMFAYMSTCCRNLRPPWYAPCKNLRVCAKPCRRCFIILLIQVFHSKAAANGAASWYALWAPLNRVCPTSMAPLTVPYNLRPLSTVEKAFCRCLCTGWLST